MTSPRWPWLFVVLAALLFAFDAAVVAASTRAAEPEPTPEPVAVVALYTQVEQPFVPGQGEQAGKARKVAPVYETTEHVAKGATMEKYTKSERQIIEELEQRLAENWRNREGRRHVLAAVSGGEHRVLVPFHYIAGMAEDAAPALHSAAANGGARR